MTHETRKTCIPPLEVDTEWAGAVQSPNVVGMSILSNCHDDLQRLGSMHHLHFPSK